MIKESIHIFFLTLCGLLIASVPRGYADEPLNVLRFGTSSAGRLSLGLAALETRSGRPTHTSYWGGSVNFDVHVIQPWLNGTHPNLEAAGYNKKGWDIVLIQHGISSTIPDANWFSGLARLYDRMKLFNPDARMIVYQHHAMWQQIYGATNADGGYGLNASGAAWVHNTWAAQSMTAYSNGVFNVMPSASAYTQRMIELNQERNDLLFIPAWELYRQLALDGYTTDQLSTNNVMHGSYEIWDPDDATHLSNYTLFNLMFYSLVYDEPLAGTETPVADYLLLRGPAEDPETYDTLDLMFRQMADDITIEFNPGVFQ